MRSWARRVFKGGSASARSAITSALPCRPPEEHDGTELGVLKHADDQLERPRPPHHLLHGETVDPRRRRCGPDASEHPLAGGLDVGFVRQVEGDATDIRLVLMSGERIFSTTGKPTARAATTASSTVDATRVSATGIR